ncbi:MAG: diguanylate cyclase, partial [Oscillospiraceae bacterium]|nr:diguanylate cyclase [Oscillospiraceae bacterium]
TRYAYLSLTGQNCKITDVEIKVDSEPVRRDYIPRIAPEVSFIDVPAGDVPNIQLDGWRTAATAGIELKDLMQISFHSFSLPTARLIWHCPFVSIFSSDDGLIGGPNFREFALIRLDGESWEEDSFASNRIITNKSEDFGNWDEWKRKNKEGLDVDIRIKHVGDTITVSSENAGIGFRNVTTIRADVPKLYVALTGDQCAITNIRIR